MNKELDVDCLPPWMLTTNQWREKYGRIKRVAELQFDHHRKERDSLIAKLTRLSYRYCSCSRGKCFVCEVINDTGT